ncbi:hypothetical protein MPRM_34630 [Mycobacterium parmense]|uniref:Uncharacterized protein n=1 Tax=Mycobacterium parmense TaxID=185642 RepID=A0A7I7YXW0_9MYCO|nr:hypothetical protein MPRM_34630 [Mycobacterium parmense]
MTPETVRLAQWPVMTTELETPLTLTMLALQAMVRCSLMPETLTRAPGAGAADVDGPRGTVAGDVARPGTVGGDAMVDRTPES